MNVMPQAKCGKNLRVGLEVQLTNYYNQDKDNWYLMIPQGFPDKDTRPYLPYVTDGWRNINSYVYNDGRVAWDNPEYCVHSVLSKAERIIKFFIQNKTKIYGLEEIQGF